MTVGHTRDILQKIFEEYGHRALQAERNENIDWKALMHAVRVAAEAKELLLTGNVTFPRPERELLLSIRKGERKYAEVATLIEQGLEELNEASAKSILRMEPNRQLVEEIVWFEYASLIKAEPISRP